MRDKLYPDIEAAAFGHLPVSDRHRLYWEEVGNPDGLPVLFLHGGPGSGIAKVHRRFFDPKAYRVVLFDQRGAGKSTPVADIAENTTQHLIDDIETLRAHLGIERWLVFGGSWGSTLALAYGQAYPEHCLGFVLRGIFLGRPCEIDWFINGMGQIFPEAHAAYRAFIPEDERGDLLTAYRARLEHLDPAVHHPAAKVWSGYESACSCLYPENAASGGAPGKDQMLALSRLEAHYFANQMFLAPNQLLDGMPAIAGKPAVIVQGRYDIICPIRSADALVKHWPDAEYVIVPDAGHSAMEPGIRAALVRATERFKQMPGLMSQTS
jgi:proline iminopeptidase